MANPWNEAGPAVGNSGTQTKEKEDPPGDKDQNKDPVKKEEGQEKGEEKGKEKEQNAGDDSGKKSLATSGPEGEEKKGDKTNSDGKSESGDTQAKPGSDGEKGKASQEVSLKAPKNSLLESGALERIAADAKQQGLTQEQAQGLVERENQAVSRFVTNQRSELERESDRWIAESKKDTEIGQGNLIQTKILTRSALDRFDPTGEVAKLLDSTGLGNNRVTLRFLSSIGKAMKQDSLHGKGGPGGSEPVTFGNALFGKVGKAT